MTPVTVNESSVPVEVIFGCAAVNIVASMTLLSSYITALPATAVPIRAPSRKFISSLSAVTPIRLLISAGDAVMSTPPI